MTTANNGTSLSDHGLGYAIDFTKDENICFSKSPNQFNFVQVVVGANLTYENNVQTLSNANKRFLYNLGQVEHNLPAFSKLPDTYQLIDKNIIGLDILNKFQLLHDKLIGVKLSIKEIIGACPITTPLLKTKISELIQNVNDLQSQLSKTKIFTENAYIGFFMSNNLSSAYKNVNTEYTDVVSTLTIYTSNSNGIINILDLLSSHSDDLIFLNQECKNILNNLDNITFGFDQAKFSIFAQETQKKKDLCLKDPKTTTILNFWDKVSKLEPPKYEPAFGSLLFTKGFFNMDPFLVEAILRPIINVDGTNVSIKWGGRYTGVQKDFMHFEVRPSLGDRSHQKALEKMDIKTIKDYLNSFKREDGSNYNY